jgi:hypothetical protein
MDKCMLEYLTGHFYQSGTGITDVPVRYSSIHLPNDV